MFFLCEREPEAARLARRACSSPASCSWSATPSSPSTASGAPTSACTTRCSGSSLDSPRRRGRSRSSARTSAPRRRWCSGSTTCSPTCSTSSEEGRQPGTSGSSRTARRPTGRTCPCCSATTTARPPARRRRRGRPRRRRWPRCCSTMHGAGADRWTGPGPRQRAGSDARRGAPPRWGDVALLFRATTGLETYEQAFREAGVPYRVDGGKTYFARREVDDALLCLRAVDDPSDGPAVYGALHSTFFGFSDDELFLFWAAGGRFDLFARAAGGARGRRRGARDAPRAARAPRRERAARARRRARAARQSVRVPRRHRRRAAHRRSPISRSWSSAPARSPAPEAAASPRSSPGPPRPATPPASRSRRWTTRATSSTCSPSTRPRASSTRSSSSSAARRAGGGGGGEPIVDREAPAAGRQAQGRAPRRVGARLSSRGATGDSSEREKMMAASEVRRLLYVATTRARDHLVVSLLRAR